MQVMKKNVCNQYLDEKSYSEKFEYLIVKYEVNVMNLKIDRGHK